MPWALRRGLVRFRLGQRVGNPLNARAPRAQRRDAGIASSRDVVRERRRDTDWAGLDQTVGKALQSDVPGSGDEMQTGRGVIDVLAKLCSDAPGEQRGCRGRD